MVSGRNDCHTSSQKIDRNSTRYSTARRRVFAIHNDEIDSQLLLQPGHRFDYCFSPGFPDYIT
jgi:hypothetical protein